MILVKKNKSETYHQKFKVNATLKYMVFLFTITSCMFDNFGLRTKSIILREPITK